MSQPLHVGQADPVKVFDLIEHLRKAFDAFFAQGPELQPHHYDRMDILMAAHNFHKLMVQSLSTDLEPELRGVFFEIASTTFRMAMDELRQETHAAAVDHQTS